MLRKNISFLRINILHSNEITCLRIDVLLRNEWVFFGKRVNLAPALIWLILTPIVDQQERKILGQVPDPQPLPMIRNRESRIFQLKINFLRPI